MKTARLRVQFICQRRDADGSAPTCSGIHSRREKVSRKGRPKRCRRPSGMPAARWCANLSPIKPSAQSCCSNIAGMARDGSLPQHERKITIHVAGWVHRCQLKYKVYATP